MTFAQFCRALAQQEANAYRAWARAGRKPPRHQPINWHHVWTTTRGTP